MSDYNTRLLIEIAHLRNLQEMGSGNDRIIHSLEMIRFIRNSELDITFDQGLIQENKWIEENGNDYHQKLKNREKTKKESGYHMYQELVTVNELNAAKSLALKYKNPIRGELLSLTLALELDQPNDIETDKLNNLKRRAMHYGDPMRQTLLLLVCAIEVLKEGESTNG